ncbi:hypothetical protein VNO80_06292 [Phaseolus coccineus]|uniref:Secreted protein n=1 Tax=Phaseolus coccineus TaxID=3886 RepID=A0AAN9RIU4_PHACN
MFVLLFCSLNIFGVHETIDVLTFKYDFLLYEPSGVSYKGHHFFDIQCVYCCSTIARLENFVLHNLYYVVE